MPVNTNEQSACEGVVCRNSTDTVQTVQPAWLTAPASLCWSQINTSASANIIDHCSFPTCVSVLIYYNHWCTIEQRSFRAPDSFNV